MPTSPRPSPAPTLALLLALAAAACGGDDPASPDAAAPPGAECGGRTGVTCGPTEFCDYGANTCGATDVTGRCAPRPDTCPALLIPERTCGCDGTVYASGCEAMLAGTDLDGSGSCRLDAGAFACGYRQCNLGGQYCRRDASDVGGEPDGFTCVALPACGGTPTCACLASVPCGAQCQGDDATGLTVTCPGG